MSNPLQWAQLGAGVLSGIGDALTGSQQNDQNNQYRQALLALQQAGLAQNNQQFGKTQAEQQREFNATNALNNASFAGNQENTQFNRGLQAKYAAVRGPLVAGLGNGQLLKDNPAFAKYAALNDPSTLPPPAPQVRPVQQTPLPPQ